MVDGWERWCEWMPGGFCVRFGVGGRAPCGSGAGGRTRPNAGVSGEEATSGAEAGSERVRRREGKGRREREERADDGTFGAGRRPGGGSIGAFGPSWSLSGRSY